MRWRDQVSLPPMTRIAVVAPAATLRAALVCVAGQGVVEFDEVVSAADLPPSAADQALRSLGPAVAPAALLAAAAPDLAALVATGRGDLLVAEAQLAEKTAQATVHESVAALLGWTATADLPRLADRLAEVGASAVALPRPRGVQPPTAAPTGAGHRTFAPLVTTYQTVPYVDVDPTLLAGAAYVLMFGAMFGDVGHGLLLLAGALLIRSGRVRRLAPLRPHWLFVAAAALSAIAFGLVYGECFGPTGLVPPGLIAPMDSPVPMLVGAVVLGAVLLGGAYALGAVNRYREGGWVIALYAPSGIAGALLFLAAGTAVAAWYLAAGWLALAAALLSLTGLVLAYLGLYASAGGGAAGATQAAIEVLDLVIRLGTNVVSFARLAAFGLTHAVLGWIIWTATVALWGTGPAGAVAAVALFVVGNAAAVALEALVAGIQALRLEYYELFSRVFQPEGRPFQPWHVPVEPAVAARESPCLPGSSLSPPSLVDAPAR